MVLGDNSECFSQEDLAKSGQYPPATLKETRRKMRKPFDETNHSCEDGSANVHVFFAGSIG
jgi:hypothetical protein